MTKTDLNLGAIKLAIFDFDQTLALHKDKDYTKHRGESDESFTRFFATAYTQPEGFYDSVEPCDTNEALARLILELRERGVKMYCLSGMKYSFHFKAKEAFVKTHYGEDIEMLFAASQELKLNCVKVLQKMHHCEPHEVLFVDDRADVIALMEQNGVNGVIA